MTLRPAPATSAILLTLYPTPALSTILPAPCSASALLDTLSPLCPATTLLAILSTLQPAPALSDIPSTLCPAPQCQNMSPTLCPAPATSDILKVQNNSKPPYPQLFLSLPTLYFYVSSNRPNIPPPPTTSTSCHCIKSGLKDMLIYPISPTTILSELFPILAPKYFYFTQYK